MTIEISVELEPILKAAAGKAGLDLTAYTHQLLRTSDEQPTGAMVLPPGSLRHLYAARANAEERKTARASTLRLEGE